MGWQIINKYALTVFVRQTNIMSNILLFTFLIERSFCLGITLEMGQCGQRLIYALFRAGMAYEKCMQV